jgi:hypothetical protein
MSSILPRDFAQTAVFGMLTSFYITDGFARAWYPDNFASVKRQGNPLAHVTNIGWRLVESRKREL